MVWPIKPDGVAIGENVRSEAHEGQSHRYRFMNGLPQFRVLRLGLLQDGDVGIGVFPEGEKSWMAFATAGAPPSAPAQQTVGRNVWGRVRSQSSISAANNRAPDTRC